jgi:hypothetical protein
LTSWSQVAVFIPRVRPRRTLTQGARSETHLLLHTEQSGARMGRADPYLLQYPRWSGPHRMVECNGSRARIPSTAVECNWCRPRHPREQVEPSDLREHQGQVVACRSRRSDTSRVAHDHLIALSDDRPNPAVVVRLEGAQNAHSYARPSNKPHTHAGGRRRSLTLQPPNRPGRARSRRADLNR